MKICKVSATLSLVILLLFPSCKGKGGSTASHAGDPIDMRHARNIEMSQIGDGVTLVTLRNPWDTTKNMSRYALVEKGYQVPGNLPAGTVTIDVPLDRSVVYSGVHVSLIDELGAGHAVSGVCDASFINDAIIRSNLKKGLIADCGSSQSPNLERIISLRPQAIILSPYEKSNETARFARAGINVIEAADYMEASPLGRAEWMRFYGRLYGRGKAADSLFAEVEKRYSDLKDRTGHTGARPAVLFDRVYSGVWSVPTPNSVTGKMIVDAGGSNPFAGNARNGSATLSVEEVVYKAKDADIWLIRYYEPGLSLKTLGTENAVYRNFKAFATGNVYGANTVEVPLFEDAAFHPDKTLREMIRIIHPEIESTPLEYYKKL